MYTFIMSISNLYLFVSIFCFVWTPVSPSPPSFPPRLTLSHWTLISVASQFKGVFHCYWIPPLSWSGRQTDRQMDRLRLRVCHPVLYTTHGLISAWYCLCWASLVSIRHRSDPPVAHIWPWSGIVTAAVWVLETASLSLTLGPTNLYWGTKTSTVVNLFCLWLLDYKQRGKGHQLVLAKNITFKIHFSFFFFCPAQHEESQGHLSVTVFIIA